MTTAIIDKIRAGRRAALASLNTRLGTAPNVVSIYEGRFPVRAAVPEFHSVRAKAPKPPVLVLTRPIAA